MPLLALLGVIVLLLALLAAMSRRQGLDAVPWELMTRALNGISLILLAVALVGASVSGALTPIPTRAGFGGKTAIGELPDIFFIMLDGHPRADTLKNDFDYDITPFLNEMERLGFAVADNSHSNYNATLLTVTSMI